MTPFAANPDYRALIAQYLASQSEPGTAGFGATDPITPIGPFQEEALPSDPVMGDRTLGDIVAGFPAFDFAPGDRAMEIAPALNDLLDNNQLAGKPAPPAEMDDQGNNVSTNSPHNAALNESVANALAAAINAAPAMSAQDTHNSALNDSVQSALDSAIAANVTGTTAQGMQATSNEAANSAVASALSSAIAATDSGPGAPGGFGTGTGFSSADAANDAVGAALGSAIDASGPGEGGGAGGDGGGGSK